MQKRRNFPKNKNAGMCCRVAGTRANAHVCIMREKILLDFAELCVVKCCHTPRAVCYTALDACICMTEVKRRFAVFAFSCVHVQVCVARWGKPITVAAQITKNRELR